MEYFAIVADHATLQTGFGGAAFDTTAYGTGTSEEAAWEDAAEWGVDDRDGYGVAKITRESYDRIKAGNPDAVEFVTSELDG